jgi:YfiH family protein
MKSQRAGSLEYLLFESIPTPHAVSTRSGGVSRDACTSLNVGQHRHDTPANIAENRRRVCNAAGLPVDHFLAMRQSHSATAALVTKAMSGTVDQVDGLQDVDALITNTPGITLMAKGADCPIVLLYDPNTPAVATIHSGWRGTAGDIVGATIETMTAAFGTRPDAIIAGIGPGIGPDCYEVGPEVISQICEAMPHLPLNQFSRPTENGHALLNLPQIIEVQLQCTGVTKIEQSGLCTFSNSTRFFSHRRDGETAGRIGLFAGLPL